MEANVSIPTYRISIKLEKERYP